MNDTKLYVTVVTLSTQENIRLLKQLEYGFKGTYNWNKYLEKTTNQARSRYFNYLIDPSFQGLNSILFCHLRMMMVERITAKIIFQLWK